MRLSRYLAHGGVASRRAAEELIRDGRVRVGGEIATDPARDVGEGSGVEVDGRAITPEPREVWALNKPEGVVSTAREPGRLYPPINPTAASDITNPAGFAPRSSTTAWL